MRCTAAKDALQRLCSKMFLADKESGASGKPAELPEETKNAFKEELANCKSDCIHHNAELSRLSHVEEMLNTS